ELVRDATDGILVDPGDGDALTCALSSLAQDRDYAEKLGQAGRERIQQSFTPERHVGALEEVYRSVARARVGR
ncbi:MAG: glycosyl transferase family 1, partial [Armatimonadetes bacterium]|nr:glycosyl transferase family 1 [Armatimonadota bacterium]